MSKRNKALEQWSKVIRSVGYCMMCDRACESKYLDAHHLIHRRVAKYSVDLRNGIALCRNCHRGKAHSTSLSEQEQFMQALEKKYPEWHNWYINTDRINQKINYQEALEELKSKTGLDYLKILLEIE